MSQQAIPLVGLPPQSLSRDLTHQHYTFPRVMLLWAATALPMIALAWIAAPALIPVSPFPAAITYGLALLPGLIWQCALALWLIRREEGSLAWSVLRERIGLVTPRHPKTGQPRRRLLWRSLPRFLILLLLFVLEVVFPFLLMFVAAFLFRSLGWIFQNFRAYTQPLDLINPDLAGRWDVLALIMIGWSFSAYCAEELFYRGVLMPRMGGRHSWLGNAALYSLSHMYRPWAILPRFLESLLIARSTQRLHSAWMAILARSAEGVVLLALLVPAMMAPGLEPIPDDIQFPHITSRPQPLIYPGGRLNALPRATAAMPGAPAEVELRHYDLSRLDLTGRLGDLEYATFDTETVWPSDSQMPPGFDPEAVLEMGKNPGLGVQSPHQRGITGQGVGIGIIDQPLLTEHQEYADQLMWYEELFPSGISEAQMHGPAVASIAVGETIGAAPEADLYYISLGSGISGLDFHYWAYAVRRLVEINEHLPPEHRIRVISMSTGWLPPYPGYTEMVAAVEDAEADGILALQVDSGQMGLGRHPNADPDDFASYEPGLFWAANFYAYPEYNTGDGLLVPMDSRTTAAPGSADGYEFSRTGGGSWTVPYVAGVYALCAQVDPGITPERFWALAYETGRTVEIEHEGQTYVLRTILDPAALIERIMRDADG